MFSDDEGSDPFDAGNDDAEDEPIPGTEAVLKQRLKAAIMFTIDQISEHEVRNLSICAYNTQAQLQCKIQRAADILNLDMHVPYQPPGPNLANCRAI